MNIEYEIIKNEIEQNNLRVQAFKEQKYNELVRENNQLKKRIRELKKVITTNHFNFAKPILKEYEVQILKSRIDKAIEYIEENRDYQDILIGRTQWESGKFFTEDILREKNIEELLETLKGSDKQWKNILGVFL